MYAEGVGLVYFAVIRTNTVEQPEGTESQRFRVWCESHVRWNTICSGSGAMSPIA